MALEHENAGTAPSPLAHSSQVAPQGLVGRMSARSRLGGDLLEQHGRGVPVRQPRVAIIAALLDHLQLALVGERVLQEGRDARSVEAFSVFQWREAPPEENAMTVSE